MNRFFLLLLALCTTNLIGLNTAEASGNHKSIVYGCGTKAAGGAFFSEMGKVQCSDGAGAESKEIKATDEQVFCFYNAECLPLTPQIRKTILRVYNERAFKKLDDALDIGDNDMNQTMIAAAKVGAIDFMTDRSQVAVQCIGKKVAGKPECPGVNDCINNRNTSSLFWKVQAYESKEIPIEADSQGFKLRTNGKSAPKGVVR